MELTDFIKPEWNILNSDYMNLH